MANACSGLWSAERGARAPWWVFVNCHAGFLWVGLAVRWVWQMFTGDDRDWVMPARHGNCSKRVILHPERPKDGPEWPQPTDRHVLAHLLLR